MVFGVSKKKTFRQSKSMSFGNKYHKIRATKISEKSKSIHSMDSQTLIGYPNDPLCNSLRLRKILVQVERQNYYENQSFRI